MPSPPLAAPNTLKILIVGVGSIGERHLRCFKNTGRCEVAFCETNPSLRAEVADRYGCPGFEDLEEALHTGIFSAAVICTPAPFHVPIAIKCVDAGLHVLIEKPLSTCSEGVDELIAMAQKANIEVRVAYIYRFLSAIRRAKELLSLGQCGLIRQVVVTSGQHFPSFRPAYRTIYYAKRESGGGAIQDALTHQIHAIEWLVSPAASVTCQAAHQVLEGVEVEDTVNLSLRLRDGTLASFALNQFQVINETVITFHGTNGSLRIELPSNRVGLVLRGEDTWNWEQLPPTERDIPFTDQALDFLGLLTGQVSHASSLSEAKQTLMANLAALQSDTANQGVDI